MLFSVFLYLFLVSSHQLYAESGWILFLRRSPRRSPVDRHHRIRGLTSVLSGCSLLPLLRRLFTFLYICYVAILLYPLWVVHPVWINNILLISLGFPADHDVISLTVFCCVTSDMFVWCLTV